MMADKQKKIGLGLIILILCAIAYYFLYFIKTPAYSIKIIQESIQKHDVATFEKHVDLDTLYIKDLMILLLLKQNYPKTIF